MINPPGKQFKKKIKEIYNDNTDVTIIIFGDIFTNSPFLSFSMVLEEFTKHGNENLPTEEQINYLKTNTKVYDLVKPNEPFITFKIVRLYEPPKPIEITAKNIKMVGIQLEYLNSLNNQNELTSSMFKKLKTEILSINFWYDKTLTSQVQKIFRKYKVLNTGKVTHRLLEAGKMSIKTDNYFKMSMFFLPKYMKYVIDKYELLGKCLNILEHSPTPDVILYEKFPKMWSKRPWYEQIKETIDFWRTYEYFKLDDCDERLQTFKTVLEARQYRGETMVHGPTSPSSVLVDEKIITNIAGATAFGTEFSYALTHEYQQEKSLLDNFNKANREGKIDILLGYQFDNLTKNVKILVPSSQLKRCCFILFHNYDNNFDSNCIMIYNAEAHGKWWKDGDQRIILFGTDVWPFHSLYTYFYQLTFRKNISSLTFHAFTDIQISLFSAPRYDMRPFVPALVNANILDMHTYQAKSLHLVPNEVTIPDFNTFLTEQILDEGVISLENRLSTHDSPLFMTFSEEDRKTFINVLKETPLAPKNVQKYHVNDRVQTPTGDITQVQRINRRGVRHEFAWKDNYPDFLLWVKDPFPNMNGLTFHATQLRDAFVIRFHWLTGFINKVVLYGKWPAYAVEEVRKLTMSTIYYHPTFNMMPIQEPLTPRQACFPVLLKKQVEEKKREERAKEEAKRVHMENARKAKMMRMREIGRAKAEEDAKKRRVQIEPSVSSD